MNARHEYLLSKGMSFTGPHEKGTGVRVIRTEISCMYVLRSTDGFAVMAEFRREVSNRLVLRKEIMQLPDKKLIISAELTGVSTRNA